MSYSQQVKNWTWKGFQKDFYSDIISSLFHTGNEAEHPLPYAQPRENGLQRDHSKERSVGLGCDQQEALAISLNG